MANAGANVRRSSYEKLKQTLGIFGSSTEAYFIFKANRKAAH